MDVILHVHGAKPDRIQTFCPADNRARYQASSPLHSRRDAEFLVQTKNLLVAQPACIAPVVT